MILWIFRPYLTHCIALSYLSKSNQTIIYFCFASLSNDNPKRLIGPCCSSDLREIYCHCLNPKQITNLHVLALKYLKICEVEEKDRIHRGLLKITIFNLGFKINDLDFEI